MGLLKDADKEQLVDLFKEHLTETVKLVMFTQEIECEFCSTTRELLEEVVALTDKIELEVLDFVNDKDRAEAYKVDKIPAIVLLGKKDIDYGIRFYGVPAGYEFTTLIEDLIDVSRGDPNLPAEVTDRLAMIDQPVHLQVMVSPTCPYCPKAVRAAHKFAMASPFVTADMVETSEFPHLTVKYDIQGVPSTIINEDDKLVGYIPEPDLTAEISKALNKVYH